MPGTRHPLEILNDATALFVGWLHREIILSKMTDAEKLAVLVCGQELVAGVLGTGAAAFGDLRPAWKVEPAVMQATQLQYAKALMEVEGEPDAG